MYSLFAHQFINFRNVTKHFKEFKKPFVIWNLQTHSKG